MCSKGISGILSEHAKQLYQLPLRWGGFGAQSSAAICGQAFAAGWVLVCSDLELLYPGVSTAVHGQDGILTAQFGSALEDVRLDVEKANAVLGSADASSLPPKTCLMIAKNALTQAESLVTELLAGCEFAPQIKAQMPFATTSNVISWDYCVWHATVEQLRYLRAGVQVGGRSMFEPTPITDTVRVHAK